MLHLTTNGCPLCLCDDSILNPGPDWASENCPANAQECVCGLTNAPTSSPTPTPTAFPTEAAPTQNRDPPTSYPTSYPTPAPSPLPTASPTDLSCFGGYLVGNEGYDDPGFFWSFHKDANDQYQFPVHAPVGHSAVGNWAKESQCCGPFVSPPCFQPWCQGKGGRRLEEGGRSLQAPPDGSDVCGVSAGVAMVEHGVPAATPCAQRYTYNGCADDREVSAIKFSNADHDICSFNTRFTFFSRFCSSAGGADPVLCAWGETCDEATNTCVADAGLTCTGATCTGVDACDASCPA
jgi:hypothetical protein